MYNAFLSDESGAVTVDWVVLTAATVGLGLATMSVVSSGVANVANEISAHLSEDHINTSFPQTVSLDGVDYKTTFGDLNSTAWNRFDGDSQDQAQLQAYYDNSQLAFDVAIENDDLATAQDELVAMAMAHYGITSDLNGTPTGTPFETNYNLYLEAGGQPATLVYENEQSSQPAAQKSI